MLLPNNATKIQIENTTVDFYEFEKDNITYLYFDTSLCGVPEPMINAMAGLKAINDTNKKLIMKNHQLPNGLFPKIDKVFDFEIQRLEEGDVLITFAYKKDSLAEVDFSNNKCLG
ncbi:hypothetical protein [Malaciobacter mytili]|uniref:Uncharacterized protein n=1 Tax=Malaciobacter mytili LMG 24559 TaxID=1032238 RepID=A0AAX2AJZ3_9BACT|nr:hypothetical protein [Malaciobacter mytili]AXH14081.1 hypothetical protein AMYT_0473 [Malaciobacter mytili LMG 24559]RXK16960.1 hypothetical protein CP985_00635 [Malaciobacter mytili LMG 24559]